MGVPKYVYRTNHLTGQVEQHLAVGEGVNFLSDGNSQPKPASPIRGTGFEVQLSPIPSDRLGPGVDFLGNQNEDKKMLALRAEAKRQRQQIADEYVRSG